MSTKKTYLLLSPKKSTKTLGSVKGKEKNRRCKK